VPSVVAPIVLDGAFPVNRCPSRVHLIRHVSWRVSQRRRVDRREAEPGSHGAGARARRKAPAHTQRPPSPKFFLGDARRGHSPPPANGYPGVTAFCASATTKTKLTGCVLEISAARRVGDAFYSGLDVSAGWLDTALACTHGSKAHVELTKSLRLHAARLEAMKAGQTEVVGLPQLMASVPNPPVEEEEAEGEKTAVEWAAEVSAAAGGASAALTAVSDAEVSADSEVAPQPSAAATDRATVAPADALAFPAEADGLDPSAALGGGCKRPRSAYSSEVAGRPAAAVDADVVVLSGSEDDGEGGSGKRPRRSGPDGGSA